MQKVFGSTLKTRCSIKNKFLNLQEFNEKRNEILIIRDRRGLGDILMCRMMFEDFARVMPDIKIVFACPSEYHDYIKDHPYIHKVIDCKNIKKSDYLVCYDISNCCIYYESLKGKNIDKHRSDIWAEYCGVKLIHHNMFLPFISDKLIEETNNKLNKISNLKKILFNPFAYDALRTLNDKQIIEVVNYLKTKNLFIYTISLEESELLSKLGVTVFTDLENNEWLSYIHAADYVVTVDTALFHYAGGIKKPMVGIFTHIDGNYRGKYFDFILVQKNQWKDCPCYNYSTCSHPNCTSKDYFTPKPCLTELTGEEIIDGIEKMLKKNI